MEKLSIVVPCFNEQETIPLFYPAVQKVLAKMPKVTPEYWFVDDGSNDNTLTELKNCMSRTNMFTIFLFLVTLVRNPLSMRAYQLQREIILS